MLDESSQKAQRIRENQRRSRERKREYVASLEARLRDFEKLGVQASMDLQKQARLVLAENRVLRVLLRDKCQMDDKDIDLHLRSARQDEVVDGASASGSCCRGRSCGSPMTSKLPSSDGPSVGPCSVTKTIGTSASFSMPFASTPTVDSDSIVDKEAHLTTHPPLQDSTPIPAPSSSTDSPYLEFSLGSFVGDVHESLQGDIADILPALVSIDNAPSLPPELTLSIPLPIPPLSLPTDVDDSAMLALMCTSQWPAPSSSSGFISCDFAFQLISTINQRRFMPLRMSDIVLQWLWHGMRASTDPRMCCVVDPGVLYSIAVNLLG